MPTLAPVFEAWPAFDCTRALAACQSSPEFVHDSFGAATYLARILHKLVEILRKGLIYKERILNISQFFLCSIIFNNI